MRACRPTKTDRKKSGICGHFSCWVASTPQKDKRRGKFLWFFCNPARDRRRREPAALTDFVRMQRERPFRLATIDPHKFLIRFLTGLQFEQTLRRLRHRQPYLL